MPEYALSGLVSDGYGQNVATWLRRRRWEDDAESWKSRGNGKVEIDWDKV